MNSGESVLAKPLHQPGPTGSLLSRLPQLLPLAADWARQMENLAMKSGKPLAFWQVADAKDVGVRRPERVRVCRVDAMPHPADPLLAAAATESGLLGAGTLGLTLGYAVFIHRSHVGERWLLRHELRHVSQYEEAGGIEPFLAEYLKQLLRDGYQAAALEQDARRHETSQAGKPTAGHKRP